MQQRKKAKWEIEEELKTQLMKLDDEETDALIEYQDKRKVIFKQKMILWGQLQRLYDK